MSLDEDTNCDESAEDDFIFLLFCIENGTIKVSFLSYLIFILKKAIYVYIEDT